MPSAEMLAAAAAAAETQGSGEEEAGPGISEDGADDEGMLVGPAPPELVEEMDKLPEDAREAEVCSSYYVHSCRLGVSCYLHCLVNRAWHLLAGLGSCFNTSCTHVVGVLLCIECTANAGSGPVEFYLLPQSYTHVACLKRGMVAT